MNVVNALGRVRPGVDDDAKAALGDAVLLRQPSGDGHRTPHGLSVLLLQFVDAPATCFLGMIRRCTGAFGSISRKASTDSSR